MTTPLQDPEEERRRKRREYEREYRSRPEVKARRKEVQKRATQKYLSDPEKKARQREYEKEYWARPENVERKKRIQKESKARSPEEVKARANEWVKRYYRENEEYREATKARAKAYDAKLKVENPEEYHRRKREYAARHRAKYPELVAARQLEYNKKARAKAQAFVNSLKEGKPCVDCGGFFPPVAMDFDHVNGDKLKAVALMAVQSYSEKKIIAEVAKCELVCSNCHRARTQLRLQKGGIDMPEEEAS